MARALFGSHPGAIFYPHTQEEKSNTLFGENLLASGKLTEATAEYESRDTRNGGLTRRRSSLMPIYFRQGSFTSVFSSCLC